MFCLAMKLVSPSPRQGAIDRLYVILSVADHRKQNLLSRAVEKNQSSRLQGNFKP
jgi:hypothetical protein